MRAPTHLLALALALAACGPEPAPPRCEDAGVALESCDLGAPAPDYHALYESVLRPTCGRAGPSCHGEGSRRALSFLDEDASRAYLLAEDVVPGRAACSELFLRVTSNDPIFRMPPAETLPEASRCDIARWIEAGAP